MLRFAPRERLSATRLNRLVAVATRARPVMDPTVTQTPRGHFGRGQRQPEFIFPWETTDFWPTPETDVVAVAAGEISMVNGAVTFAATDVTIPASTDSATPAYIYLQWTIGASSGTIVSPATTTKPTADGSTGRYWLYTAWKESNGDIPTLGRARLFGPVFGGYQSM